jgi:error-prone DNA polymerase
MYAELHCHSAFSFLDGASPPDELLAEAHRLGIPALALTDRNGIYGSLACAHAAKPLGIQAITGAEVTLTDGSHLILLAETPQGYSNLCRLLTETHLGAERLDPRLPLGSIEARHEGLIILSGSRRDGLLPRTLETEGLSATRKLAEQCRETFGRDHFFVEIQRNRVRGDLATSRALIDVAADLQLGVLATGNVQYHTRDLHRLHDVMVAIRHRTTLDGSHRVRNPNSEFYLRPLEELVSLFADCPDAVATSLAIAERCKAFDITRDLGYTFPDFRGADLAPAPQALAELCRARLDERYPQTSVYRAQAIRRLEDELKLIELHNLSGFFLV